MTTEKFDLKKAATYYGITWTFLEDRLEGDGGPSGFGYRVFSEELVQAGRDYMKVGDTGVSPRWAVVVPARDVGGPTGVYQETPEKAWDAWEQRLKNSIEAAEKAVMERRQLLDSYGQWAANNDKNQVIVEAGMRTVRLGPASDPVD